jgi:murein DD-endopeptidase MepM/ murein hydrolase activator NlpD
MEKNGLSESGFRKWIFEPPMLYRSTEMWWGHRGKRYRPHEGLDFCMFEDGRNRVIHLDGKTMIPAMYDGVVIAIVHDFLGRSIVLEHDFQNRCKDRFCTVYAHIRPQPHVSMGAKISKGSVIATVEDSFKSKTDISSHLHISLGWISCAIPNEKLVWPELGSSEVMTLLDPLDFI